MLPQMRTSKTLLLVLFSISMALLLGACEEGAQHCQQQIIREHAPRVREIVREDIERGVSGVSSAATKLARGFLIEDHERRQNEMRTALHLLRQPPRGIPELMISPISFLAAVDEHGIVIARDATPDPMVGFDAGQAFGIVRRALEGGEAGYALEEFPNLLPDQPGSRTVLYAAPVRHQGRIVGVVLAGTPLWRTAQRVGRQIQAEEAEDIRNGGILWVYLFESERLHHHGTPSDMDSVVPDATARAAGLERSPGGFTGELAQFGRWYGYGVFPLPRIAPDVGAVVFCSDPL
jgi:hypothetical protein